MHKDNNLKSQISIIINRLQAHDYEYVINKSTILIRKYPNNDFLWNLKGLALQSSKKIEESIDCFETALRFNSNNFAALNNLGNSYKRNHQFVMAEKSFDRCLEKNPNYLNSIVNLANLKVILNEYEKAIELYKKAISINDHLPSLYINLAMAYQSTNRFDKSLIILENCLTKFPEHTKADKLMSIQINYKDDDNHLHIMIEKLKKYNLTEEQKIELYFAIGKAFDDRNEYENAYSYFLKGNNLKRKKLDFNIENKIKLFEEIKLFFKNFKINKKLNTNYNKKFVFIFGLPRSGTTLTEKILSSHRQVSAGGEINFINDFFGKNFVSSNKLNKEKINKYLEKDLNQEFTEYLKPFNLPNQVITDKSLNMYWYLGFIKIFFPNAKLINCRRNPKDNCLSIFKQLFEDGEGWKYNEKELISYYKLYDEITKFWKDSLKDQILEINYEELVTNTKSNVEKILKFCELDWDENCMQHHKSNSPIKTLSLNQANKPIYSSSVHSANNYKNFLKDFS